MGNDSSLYYIHRPLRHGRDALLLSLHSFCQEVGRGTVRGVAASLTMFCTQVLVFNAFFWSSLHRIHKVVDCVMHFDADGQMPTCRLTRGFAESAGMIAQAAVMVELAAILEL